MNLERTAHRRRDIIGSRIRVERKRSGIALHEVAKCIGVREANVQKYESGVTRNMSYNRICAMAAVLGWPQAYLAGLNGGGKKQPVSTPEDFLRGARGGRTLRQGAVSSNISKAYLSRAERVDRCISRTRWLRSQRRAA